MDSPRPFNAPDSARAGFTLVELLMVLTPVLFLGLGVITAYLYLGRNLTRLANTQQQDVKARRALFYFTQDVGSANAFTSTTTSNLTMTVPTTLTLSNCAVTSGSTTVTCASTSGLATGMTLSGLGIAPTATVSAIANGTTLVMSSPATATNSGLTVNVAGAATTVTYLYNLTADNSTTPVTPANSLTRKVGSTSLVVLLTDIDATATGPSNGFVYYNPSGTTVTAAASVKEVEFAFTTKVGSTSNGTLSTYKIISPRVVVRNKDFLP